MGQSPSQPLRRGGSKRRSLRSPFPIRRKPKPPLSATFAVPDSARMVETLNVNTATAEQLMTLPGLTRQLAQNIVDHRNVIGRFQKIEDLALVSGIGAEKLAQIRPEICVKRTRNTSASSSRAPSLDSVVSTDSSRPSIKPINVNTASVFELQCVNGLNQEIAANLVDRRHKKGPFKSLEDLVKVKGINQLRLGAVRSQLSIDSCEDLSRINGFKTDNNKSETPSKANSVVVKTSTPNKTPGHRKTMSAPIKMSLGFSNGFSMAPVNDIFDLLSAYSHRPIVEEEFRYERNGQRALRIATWNMHDLCSDKVGNPGVREVVCRTIFENRFSIIALQDVLEGSALRQLCNELNRPTLRRVAEWKENSRQWKYCLNQPLARKRSGLGFIYDSCAVSPGIELETFKEIPLVDKSEINQYKDGPPNAVLAGFQFGDWKCWILNVLIREAHKSLSSSEAVVKRISEQLQNVDIKGESVSINDVFAVVGDFTGVTSNTDIYGVDIYGFQSILPGGTSTAFNPLQTTPYSSSILSFCNILVASESAKNGNRATTDLKLNNQRRPLKHSLSNGNAQFNVTNLITSSNVNQKMFRKFSTTNDFKSKDTLANSNINLSNAMATGYYGVVRQGLCHMAIPQGWNWGGPASGHCPLWLEVFRDRSNADSIVRENGIQENDTSSDFSLSSDYV